MKAMIIPVDGDPAELELEPDENGSHLRSLQRAVGGRIEPFDALFGGSPTLYVNEEGLFVCRPNRAVHATREMEEAGYLSQIDGRPVREGELYAVLFGSIVAVGFDPGTGEDRDISDEEARRVVEAFAGTGGSGAAVIARLLRGGLA